MKPALKIAIAGLGTVGAGVVQLLDRQAELLATRAGSAPSARSAAMKGPSNFAVTR